MTRSNSPRSTFFVQAAEDRRLTNLMHEFDRRTRVLESLREINREEVHPRSTNYCGNYVTSELYLAHWGVTHALITENDVQGLNLEPQNRNVKMRLYY